MAPKVSRTERSGTASLDAAGDLASSSLTRSSRMTTLTILFAVDDATARAPTIHYFGELSILNSFDKDSWIDSFYNSFEATLLQITSVILLWLHQIWYILVEIDKILPKLCVIEPRIKESVQQKKSCQFTTPSKKSSKNRFFNSQLLNRWGSSDGIIVGERRQYEHQKKKLQGTSKLLKCRCRSLYLNLQRLRKAKLSLNILILGLRDSIKCGSFVKYFWKYKFCLQFSQLCCFLYLFPRYWLLPYRSGRPIIC